MAPALIALLVLSACGDALPSKTTERRTTATLRYNDVARTVEDAQAEVRAMCGEAEVLSVSQPRPVVGDTGEILQEVTAQCVATYDGRGRLVLDDD
ncbi:hypothetical protein ACVDG3_06190 [Meridianimarinicoccus sp. RP-17]|uniref:hypothetical protein n=1 Tax=Meridianimarinicoccus zhengii TaxID=2056810 RepID=UPI0013A69AD6|nr:hypothetical protein [Phycocomes zhengii]